MYGFLLGVSPLFPSSCLGSLSTFPSSLFVVLGSSRLVVPFVASCSCAFGFSASLSILSLFLVTLGLPLFRVGFVVWVRYYSIFPYFFSPVLLCSVSESSLCSWVVLCSVACGLASVAFVSSWRFFKGAFPLC